MRLGRPVLVRLGIGDEGREGRGLGPSSISIVSAGSTVAVEVGPGVAEGPGMEPSIAVARAA